MHTVVVPVAQDMEWVELNRLGIVNNDVSCLDCGKHRASVLSSLPDPVDAVAVYRDAVSSNAWQLRRLQKQTHKFGTREGDCKFEAIVTFVKMIGFLFVRCE
ncbi:unnamed protein product [Fusarium graminearum]|nr:unnamed protein product [Fusarium graminearum]